MAQTPLLNYHDSANGASKVRSHDALRQTDAEFAMGATPTNYAYEPGHVKRYGCKGDGTTDDTTAFQKAVNLARRTGCDVLVPHGDNYYVLRGPVDCTISAADAATYTAIQGYTIRGTGNSVIDTGGGPGKSTIIAEHTGHVFDCTGSFGVNFANLSLGSGSSTYPKTVWFFARTSNDGGSIHRVTNCRARIKCSESIVYNYGAEDDQYDACNFFNIEGGANAKVFTFTSTNIRSLTSSFITVATGTRSTIAHHVNGGAFGNFSHHANADVFYLDNIRFLKVMGTHLICADGTGGGRSHFYVNTANGASDNMTLFGVTGEAGASTNPAYGIYIGDTTATVGNWMVHSCAFPNATNSIRSHTNVTMTGMDFRNVGNTSLGGGIRIDGDFTGSHHVNIDGGLTVNGGYIRNNAILRQGEATQSLIDNSAASGKKEWRQRSTAGQWVLSAYADDTTTNLGNAIIATSDGSNVSKLAFDAAKYAFDAIPGSYADDAAAAAAGVAVGELYRTTSTVKVRVS